ncbi:MAG: sigma-70 family RNA polymerase sigma factor [Bacteroidota bacterium]
MTQKRENTISSLIKTYNRRLFQFIRGRVPNNADAEDILQEVWYQLSKVVDISSIEQISGWLFQVARNKVTDNYRKQRPALLDDFSYKKEEGELNVKQILMAENPSPEMENLKELFWEALFDALEELPAQQREVFIWNELEDQTFQEIADRTGVNIKTLISRKRYAVQHLRKRLEALYGEFLDF